MRKLKIIEHISLDGVIQSYDETVQTAKGHAVRQRVDLTLWDTSSIWDHAVTLGYKESPQTRLQRRWQQGRFSEENSGHFVEYNATVSLTGSRIFHRRP
jgi:hypothetical protein